jgi:hypothetical protein
MAKHYDKHRKEAPKYQLGDLVMLNGKNISTRRPSRKFDHKLHGPFKIIKVISPAAVRLELPSRWRIHNVFHVQLLEPFRQSTMSGRPPPDLDQVLKDADDIIPSNEYLPLTIHDTARKRHKRKMVVKHLVEWEGWPNVTDFTWEPYEHLKDSVRAHEALKEYHSKNPEKLIDPDFKKEWEKETVQE